MEISIGSKKRKAENKSPYAPGKVPKKKFRSQMASTAQLAGSALANSALATRPGGFRFQGMMTEKKVVDIGNGNFGINSTGTITAINLIQTGSSYYQRVGRKINMTSVEIRGSIFSAGATPTAETARLMILYDKQPNGALPSNQDVLQTVQQSGAITTTVNSRRNLDKRDRFVCLWDHQVECPGQQSGAASNDAPINTDQISTVIHKYIRLPNLVTQYQADSSPAVIGDIATGSLFLLTFGENPSGDTSHQLSATIRLRYKDM